MIPGKNVFASAGPVLISATGNTEILRADVAGLEHVLVQISAVGQALDTFLISAAGHPQAAESVLASAAGDFTTPVAPVIKASGDLTALAAGASGYALVDVRGWRQLIVSASSANIAGSTVTAYITGA